MQRFRLLVTGIVSTGDAEDNAILVPLSVAQAISGHPGQFRQLFVSALTKPADGLAERDPKSLTPTEYDRWFCSPYISSISYQIEQVLPGTDVRAIRRVADTEGRILSHVSTLLWIVTLAALIAAALAVAATSATTVLQRRAEIGIMKAIGATNALVGGIFLAEQLMLAFAGGVVRFRLRRGAGPRARHERLRLPGCAPSGAAAGRSRPGRDRSGCRQPDPFAARGSFQSRPDSAGRVMFGRLLWQLLRGSRGRLAVALIAVVSGAAVISAMLNLNLDIGRKLTQEFRMLGANLVISSPSAGEGDAGSAQGGLAASGSASSPALMDEQPVLSDIERLRTKDVVAAAPYLYVVARNADRPVVVAGTWLDQIPQARPTWKLNGAWIASRDDATHCLVGRNVAQQFQLRPGQQVKLNYLSQSAQLTVSGILDAGGTEDNQIFVNLPVAQNLAAMRGKIDLVQLSVSGTSASIAAVRGATKPSHSGIRCPPHPPGHRSRRQSSGPHAAACCVDGGADPAAHRAMRAGHHGRPGVGAPRRRRLDESPRRLDFPDRSLVLVRSRSAGRRRRIDRLLRRHCPVAVDGQKSLRRLHHAALGNFPADDRLDGVSGDGRRAAASPAGKGKAGNNSPRRRMTRGRWQPPHWTARSVKE